MVEVEILVVRERGVLRLVLGFVKIGAAAVLEVGFEGAAEDEVLVYEDALAVLEAGGKLTLIKLVFFSELAKTMEFIFKIRALICHLIFVKHLKSLKFFILFPLAFIG